MDKKKSLVLSKMLKKNIARRKKIKTLNKELIETNNIQDNE